jgi:hypothetical protein
MIIPRISSIVVRQGTVHSTHVERIAILGLLLLLMIWLLLVLLLLVLREWILLLLWLEGV